MVKRLCLLEMRLDQQATASQPHMEDSEGSEQERHKIRPLWLLLENGLERARTELRDKSGGYSGGYGDRLSVTGDGEKWIYLRHNLEVILIGLGNCDVKSDKADS